MTFSELGRIIAGKREALGISREELAVRLGVKPKTVENGKRGKRRPVSVSWRPSDRRSAYRRRSCSPVGTETGRSG